ncbi:bcl2-associated agonist of cell death isoform X3 [Rattus norvegicus]|nr:bcl2-associated agonist of cell death isoform X3 [Rattus norvegicus]|eukprot:XP_006230959.1 PREDICTED: bcl2-associated agonist of cell death isoform X2 [Rattus norvegicus]
MFQIPEFEPSEQEDASTTDRGLGPSLTEDQPGPYLAPGLLGSIVQQQPGQAANNSHHGGAGTMETRSRHSSYPAGTEEDEGMEEELSPFRGRSRSAPPNLWAAQRYGRELRRMSDEFEGSFKGEELTYSVEFLPVRAIAMEGWPLLWSFQSFPHTLPPTPPEVAMFPLRYWTALRRLC